MENQQEISQEKTKKQPAGLFGSMSATQKVLLIIFGLAIFFLIWTFVFGGITNFYQLIFFLASFLGVGALFYAMIFFIQMYLTPELFSPKKDYFNRLVNLAIDLKPTNVYDLYFRGDKDKKRVKAGKIVGLLGIPYFIGNVKTYGKPKDPPDTVYTDEKGNKHKKGEMVYKESKVLKRKIPVFESVVWGDDGDTFFIYESGWFFIKKRHFLRCHRSLHGDLNGDVEIYDYNPIPYGSLYEYPFKQLQAHPERIMIQNQLEIIIATQEHQLDLISQGVDSAVYFNPYFRLLNKQQSEMSAQ